MIPLLASLAFAGQIEAVTPNGALRPGVPGSVLVAGVDDRGRSLGIRPRASVGSGAVRVVREVSPGIWELSVTPPVRAGSVAVDVSFGETREAFTFRVSAYPKSTMTVPERVDAYAGTRLLPVDLVGEGLPPPEDLLVAVGEGRVASIEGGEGRLRVTFELDETKAPRAIPFGIRDARGDEAPAWGLIRLRARRSLDLVTEPGAEVAIEVGGRTYGPFATDDFGAVVDGYFEHYPSEMNATLVASDDLGNVTRQTLALTTGVRPSMIALASGDLLPESGTPLIWVRAIHGDGVPWTGRAPECRTPGVGELSVVKQATGTWTVPVLGDAPVGDLRIGCQLGPMVAEGRIGGASGIPARLYLRVWPEELLSADFPVADVQVMVEDVRGERLPVDGVTLRARHGEIVATGSSDLVARGEYRGTASYSEDRLTASYVLPTGSGHPRGIQIAHSRLSNSGPALIHARLFDRSGRPLRDIPVTLSTVAEEKTVRTDERGWATTTLALPTSAIRPVRITAATERLTRSTLGLLGSASPAGPGQPDLEVSRDIVISAGRIQRLVVSVAPRVLYLVPGAVATVSVDVLDRAGRRVDVEPSLEADIGFVGPVERTEQGAWRFEVSPPRGERAREVTLTVRGGEIAVVERLELEPRPVSQLVGLGVGVTTNFGRLTSPVASLDWEVRFAALARQFMVRLGLSIYGMYTEAETEFGLASARATYLPVTLAALYRYDAPGGVAFWVGGGSLVALHRTEIRYEEDAPRAGLGILPPGLALIGGVGRRVPGGELMLEVRGTGLAALGGTPGLRGLVGGIAVLAGYRLVW